MLAARCVRLPLVSCVAGLARPNSSRLQNIIARQVSSSTGSRLNASRIGRGMLLGASGAGLGAACYYGLYLSSDVGTSVYAINKSKTADTKYKFVFFNARGRGELVRWVFAAAGQPYEDDRTAGDNWETVKKETPFGQVPFLVVDGESFCQSIALARFLAKRFGLYAADDLDALRIEMVSDCVEDVRRALLKFAFEEDVAKKAEMKKTFENVQLPEYLNGFEKMLAANKSESGFFVGDKLTLADLAMVQMLVWLGSIKCVPLQVNLKSHPRLGKLKTKVEAMPRIRKWMDERPKTDL